jgi:RNA polymerase sigma-70 factor (ECF subfamily)
MTSALLDNTSEASALHQLKWRPRVPKMRTASVTKVPTGLDQGTINDLMARVGLDRDVQAFERLYRYFFPKVRSYMFQVAKDRSVADELAQEAMAAVWRKAHLFDPERGQASTWIFAVARNLRIDALRRGPRPDFDAEDPSLIPEPVEHADAAYLRRESAETVRNAIKDLNSDQLQVLKMSYFEDMPHSAIATALGIPIGTVKSRIRMACERLRVSLREKL